MSSFFSMFSTSPGPTPKSKPQAVPKKKTAAEERGEDLTRQAVVAEQSNPAEALRLYKEALTVWVELMRVETDAEKKKGLSQFIDHYMQRAEVMKTVVNDQKKVQSDFKNYSNPTVSSKKRTASATAARTTPARKPHQALASTASARQRVNQRPQAQAQGQGQGQAQGRGKASSDSNEHETQMMSEMLDSSPGVR